MKDLVNISDSIGQHIDWISGFAELGFSEIDLHNVNRSQERFIDDFGAAVLPELKKTEVAVNR